MKKMLMKSISGVRGIVGDSLRPDNVLRYSSAFGIMIDRGKVVVGRDSRISGEMFENTVISGLMSVGCDVIRVGVCPTPTIQYAVEKLNAAGGIAITASHNPNEWNGLKFINENGLFLNEKDWNRFDKIYNKKKMKYSNWKKVGRCDNYDSAIEKHIEKILDLPYISISSISRKKFKVVVDCVNGAGGKIIPYLLQKLGCTVYPLNCDRSGHFPRNPEPLPKNLVEIRKKVKDYNADIGFAVDPDADRLAVIDEKGVPLGEDYTLVLAVKFILERRKGVVVVNETTSRAIDDLADDYDVKVKRTKVGEIYVSQEMKEVKSPIGGEGNGGVILPEVHFGRDAMVGITIIMQMLSESGLTIGELKKEMPGYFMIKNKMELSDSVYSKLVEKLRKENSLKELSLIDGFKVNKKSWWFHIRKSNTEPIVRIVCEAKSKKKAQEEMKKIEEIIEDIKK